MIATKTTTSRKTLATQIDRLDAILDGLADAIPDVIRDSIAKAARDAVQAAILDVLADPAMLARIRDAVQQPQSEPVVIPLPTPASMPTPTPAAQPRRVNPITMFARSAITSISHVATAAREQTHARVTQVRDWASRQAERLLAWRKPVGVSLGAAVGVSMLAAIAGPIGGLVLTGLTSFGLCLTSAALTGKLTR